MTRAHAILSASSAHRWMKCPASPRLEETFPDKSSEYAAEGTLAHAVAELKLQHFLGRITDAEHQDALTGFGRDARVTPAFLEAVDAYVGICKEKIEQARGRNSDAVILLEDRLDFSHVVPEGFGTGDLVIISDGIIDVTDLKFGKGLEVLAVENEQLMLYGLGAVEKYKILYDFDWVRLTICQPRLSTEPSVWEIPVAELETWGRETVVPLAKEAWEGSDRFVPGDHCGFCRAKAVCRARAEEALTLTAHDFAPPETLSDEEIAAILEPAARVKKWADDVQTYAREQAEKGRKFSGWKLVHGRSNRRYSDQDAVAKRLTEAGIPQEVIYERSLLGITALEKAITKKRFAELLGDLITKPPGAPTLVPVSDERPEVEAFALDGFEVHQPGEPAA